MRTPEELNAALREQPDDFGILYEYTAYLTQSGALKNAFALAERAVAVFESNPDETLRECYLELKRLSGQLVREHLDVLLGDVWFLLDQRWTPVFKLGRPREIAVVLGAENIKALDAVIAADQLKKLLFLNVTITDNVDLILSHLGKFRFEPLRILNLGFAETPTVEAFRTFLQSASAQLSNLATLNIRMPQMTNEHVILARQFVPQVESFGVVSIDRTTLVQPLGDFFADDPNSQHLMSLALIGTSIGNDGLWSILTSDHFPKLHTLDLHDGILTNAAAKMLDADIELMQLQNIDLRYNMIDPAGIAILQNVPLTIKCSEQHVRPENRKA